MSESVSATIGTEPLRTSAAKSHDAPLRISFVIEWANTTYNGVPRFFGFLDIMLQQWRDLTAGVYPDNLDQNTRDFLDNIDDKPEVIIVSGERIESTLAADITQRCTPILVPEIHINAGMEYYALKNYGAELASGEIVCFLDSDVYPNTGWLAHLLGTFANPDIRAVAGQPYVAPIDLFSRAFALGWTYELADTSGRLFHSEKFYANNFALHRELFNEFKFPSLQRRTRGAGTILGRQLAQKGTPVWQNRKALVDHPAPAGWHHLCMRALAHGRDLYMKTSEARNVEGLRYSQEQAAFRLVRGIANTARHWKTVGLKPLETLPAGLIILSYYTLVSVSGLLTHISPEFMGRRFRL